MRNINSTEPQQQPPPAAEAEAEEYFEAAESFESTEEPETCAFTCEICIEPTSTNKEFRNNGLCVHPFCIDCITKYIQVNVEHDPITEIKCPGLNCDRFLDPLTCRSLIPPRLFEKWCDVTCERVVLGLERCYCPNRECSVVVVNECGGNVKRSRMRMSGVTSLVVFCIVHGRFSTKNSLASSGDL